MWFEIDIEFKQQHLQVTLADILLLHRDRILTTAFKLDSISKVSLSAQRPSYKISIDLMRRAIKKKLYRTYGTLNHSKGSSCAQISPAAHVVLILKNIRL